MAFPMPIPTQAMFRALFASSLLGKDIPEQLVLTDLLLVNY